MLVLSVNVLSSAFTVLPYVKYAHIAVEMKMVHIYKLILVYGTGVLGLNWGNKNVAKNIGNALPWFSSRCLNWIVIVILYLQLYIVGVGYYFILLLNATVRYYIFRSFQA